VRAGILRIARRVVPAAFALAAVVAGCSLGEGKGEVSGSLDATDCWRGAFNLNPDFFAGVPYRKTSVLLRIQRSGDYETFSDGLTILIDDIQPIRAGLLGQALLSVALVGIAAHQSGEGDGALPAPRRGAGRDGRRGVGEARGGAETPIVRHGCGGGAVGGDLSAVAGVERHLGDGMERGVLGAAAPLKVQRRVHARGIGLGAHRHAGRLPNV